MTNERTSENESIFPSSPAEQVVAVVDDVLLKQLPVKEQARRGFSEAASQLLTGDEGFDPYKAAVSVTEDTQAEHAFRYLQDIKSKLMTQITANVQDVELDLGYMSPEHVQAPGVAAVEAMKKTLKDTIKQESLLQPGDTVEQLITDLSPILAEAGAYLNAEMGGGRQIGRTLLLRGLTGDAPLSIPSSILGTERYAHYVTQRDDAGKPTEVVLPTKILHTFIKMELSGGQIERQSLHIQASPSPKK